MEDERFYSVLEIALEIKGEIDFGATGRISVPAEQKLIKFPILLPAWTPSLGERYAQMRLKALMFLEKEGHVENIEDQRAYWAPDDGKYELQVKETEGFLNLVELLRDEQERREYGKLRDNSQADAMTTIETVCNGFHRSALRFRKHRTSFQINDEYDVQALLWALLEGYFPDIRDEEPTPSHAGKSARADFVLHTEQIIVETKMTRDGLNDGKLGDELILDIARYRKHPRCKGLFCFVYDRDHRLKNPSGLETDLSGNKDGLHVRVRIRPVR